jgi:UBX domain-containing protein 1
MNSPPEDSETRIASFIEATSASRENAHQYLEMAEWDVGVAIELWLDGDGAEGASSAADEEEPAAERAPPSNPAPGPATGRAIHTLNDLNASATHDGHDDDDDSDQDYFAGGEKSGLAVQGNPQSERVNDLLQGLFERARR